MRFFIVFCIVWLLLYISACSSVSDHAMPGPALGDLRANNTSASIQPEQDETVPVISTGELLNEYRQLLADINEAQLKKNVRKRLADLELRQSEDLLAEGKIEAEPFANAIAIYEQLVPEIDSDQERVRIQYQLSKAYAMAGRNQDAYKVLNRLAGEDVESVNKVSGKGQKEQQFVIESYFRLAEAAFNQGDYLSAKTQYQRVLEQSVAGPDPSDFEQNAYYMLGWSEFKLNRYEDALSAFIEVLDQLLLKDSDLGYELISAQPLAYESLSRSEQNLVSDSLRAMSISFSYLGGPESISEILTDRGDRSYSDLPYKELGNLYRSQERYRDAADTYLAYVDYQPFSSKAPEFSELAIQTYFEGNFPSLILPAKEAFVQAYGVNSLFWLAQESVSLDALKPFLHEYLQELSSHYHASAQVLVSNQTLTSEQVPADKKEQLLLAADYYDQFVKTFPDDAKTPELAFYRAEALFEAKEYVLAVDAYQFVAYELAESFEYGNDSGSSPYGNDSAYNLILSIDKVLESSVQSDWQDRKLNASIRFADTYPQDERAPLVLAQVMDSHFQNEQYEQAIALAERLRNWVPAQSEELVQHATLIAAKSEFTREQYFTAEMLYRQLLEAVSEDDERSANIQQQIAASLYRQAEVLLQTEGIENKRSAIDRFLASADFLPDSDIASVARFDAANYLMELQDWQQSIEQFLIFSDQYPQHVLAQRIPAKLAFLYQKTEQWHLAADNLLAMIEIDSSGLNRELDEGLDKELKPQSLYLAAQLYQQAGSGDRAKQTYKRYIAEYPSPQLLNMEAKYQLVLLSPESGSDKKRNAWIDQLAKVSIHETDRELYLSAWASNQQAEQIFQRYSAQKLSLPLNKSLKKKQKALQKTLKAYTQVLDFGVAEFTTLASYRMGEVYAGLSQSVMTSARPKDLDALALEQYEILLEEQAFPFEEKAIELHEANARRSWHGEYDQWVQQSFDSLSLLLPVRYNKIENRVEVSRGIY